MTKKGILIVAYGIGTWSANQSFFNFCQEAKNKFEPLGLRHAFTSENSRKNLAERGKKSDSVKKALEKMIFEKYTHIYIQSLHLVSGFEYNELLKTVKNMMRVHAVSIFLAKPLLQEDIFFDDIIKYLAKACDFVKSREIEIFKKENDKILKNYSKNHTICENKEENLEKTINKTAIVYMGHGSHKTRHDTIKNYNYRPLEELDFSVSAKNTLKNISADFLYLRLANALHIYDNRVFLSCMKGSLNLHSLVSTLKEREYTHIHLFPFLSLVGLHTLDDMAGDEKNSWKSKFISEGFQCDAYFLSLLQNNDFIQLWLKSLENLIKE